MKLFALYIGGEHPRANIEVHDMRFVVARSLRDTYDLVRQQWWGTPESLHVDCWAQLDHADGFDVHIRPEPFSGGERLYFVNLGGYDESDFLEQHKNVFIVARSLSDAKTRALRANAGWKQLHRDELYEVEQALCLANVVREQGLHVHLVPSSQPRAVAFHCKYTNLKPRTPRRG